MNRFTLRTLLPKPHWGARYLRDRLALAWWQWRHRDAPWLAPDAVRFLDEWLVGDELMVEFGAGRSTSWFGARVARLLAVEHDPGWYQQVQAAVAAQPLGHVRMLQAQDDPAVYLEPIEAALASSLADVVLVDGACRDASALWALEHVGPGGLIIVDNAERYLPSESLGPESLGPSGSCPTAEWDRFWAAVGDSRRVWFDCGVWSTLLVFR